MSLVFTTTGEFRGKGNRQVRQGPRGKAGESYKSRPYKQLTPVEIARNRLVNELERGPFGRMEKNNRYKLADEMTRMEQLRFMNMRVLACALDFLNNHRGETDTDTFTYPNIKRYIEYLLPSQEERTSKRLTPVDLDLMNIRLQATLLRYILAVSYFRDQESTEATGAFAEGLE